MNDRTRAVDAEARVVELFEAQRRAFDAHPFPTLQERRTHLRALQKQLLRYQDLLADAMHRDFGGRSASESRMLDLLPSVLGIRHALSHLRRWMRPSRRATELLFMTNSLRVHYQPKGVVGVIATWNFPVYLSIGPLAAALAAGNRVLIKMPETTPATNEVLRRMLAEVFPRDHVALVGEELEDPNVFSSLPFDHLVFTGSPGVGRIVMAQAAKHLTPVTLELGGKSPALVMRGCPVAEAARSIAHGKGTNGGQICVSPDYALVPREQVGDFVAAAKAAFVRMYGARAAECGDYTAVASERQAGRMRMLRRGLPRALACAHGVQAPPLLPDRPVPSSVRQRRAAPFPGVVPGQGRFHPETHRAMITSEARPSLAQRAIVVTGGFGALGRAVAQVLGPRLPERLQKINSAFHWAILDGSGSPRLRGMLASLIDMPIVIRSHFISTLQDKLQSLQHHRDLAAAVRAGDGELARQVMQLHLRVAAHRFKRQRIAFGESRNARSASQQMAPHRT